MQLKNSWTEKLNCPKTNQAGKIKTLEVASINPNMPVGSRVYMPTPLEIDAYVQQIPRGKSVSFTQMCEDLAKKNSADFTCTATASLYLRIVAEAAFEKFNIGDRSHITAFWRVIEANSAIAEKLSFGSMLIKQKRTEELLKDAPKKPNPSINPSTHR